MRCRVPTFRGMRRLSLAVPALVGLTSPSPSPSFTPALPLADHAGVIAADSYAPWPQASNAGTLHALDPRTGTVLFDLDTGTAIDSYPALGKALLVVGVTDGRLLAVGA
jgi:hypothetical protein